jgi:hypothetical protein
MTKKVTRALTTDSKALHSNLSRFRDALLFLNVLPRSTGRCKEHRSWLQILMLGVSTTSNAP